MQPIPIPVKNVTIWPWLNWNPRWGIGPVIPPVFVDGTGTYSIGTLIMDIFYNLDLTAGQNKYDLHLGGMYHATVQTSDGSTLSTPWMYCTRTGNQPEFGRTIHLGLGGGDAPFPLAAEAGGERLAVKPGGLIKLAKLKDVRAAQSFPPPAIGMISVIEDATGELVATKMGTPHLMGFLVNGGRRSNGLAVGMKRVVVLGTRVDNGSLVSLGNLTCEDAGDPALFLQTFP